MANTTITVGTSAISAVSFAPTGTTFRVEVGASQQGTMWLLSKVGAGAYSNVAILPLGSASIVDNPVAGLDYKLEFSGPTAPSAYWS